MPVCSCGCNKILSRQRIHHHLIYGAPLKDRITANANDSEEPESEDFIEDDMPVPEEEYEVQDMADNPAFDAPELGSPDIDPVDESCIDSRVNAIYRKEVRSLHELGKNWDWVDLSDNGIDTDDEDMEQDEQEEPPSSCQWDDTDDGSEAASEGLTAGQVIDEIEREQANIIKVEIIESSMYH
jgi:hypothetical protein